jgi:hypothetical protein
MCCNLYIPPNIPTLPPMKRSTQYAAVTIFVLLCATLLSIVATQYRVPSQSHPQGEHLVMKPLPGFSSQGASLREADRTVRSASWRSVTDQALGLIVEYPDAMLAPKCGEDHAFVPVATYSDTSAGRLYVFPETIASTDRDPHAHNCTDVPVTPAMIASNELHPVSLFYSWVIHVHQDVGEDILESVLQEAYGSGCRIAERSPSVFQEGVEDIQLSAADGTNMADDCMINFAIAIKYAKNSKQLVHWKMGQESKFWSNAAATVSHDDEMLKRFMMLRAGPRIERP